MIFFFSYMLTGVFAGLASGMLGIGGGVIVVPVLLCLLSMQGVSAAVSTHVALATSLAAMIFTSFLSALSHYRLGTVLTPVFYRMSVGVLLGALLGVMFARHVPGYALQILFALFLFCVSAQMWSGYSASSTRRLPGSRGLVAGGTVIGLFSSLFGIGGGSLTVPFLNWRGVSSRMAVGTSAALGVPVALFSAGCYAVAGAPSLLMPDYSIGYVYLPAFLGIAATSGIFARFGARVSLSISEQKLKNSFALLLTMVALSMIWRNLRGEV